MKITAETSKIILMMGSGGVGKTTLAASLAVGFCESGFDTTVLTVDPAKRLANALGLTDFNNTLQKVPLESTATLQASMLDTSVYFDSIIQRLSPTESIANKILQNPLYKACIQNLGGTEEYAAMERLLEFYESNSSQKIVVDTPPVENASMLLTSPRKLAEFLDKDVFKWFSNSVNLFGKSTQVLLGFLSKILGDTFIIDLNSFFTDFENIREKLLMRQQKVNALIRSDETSLFLITTATKARLQETKQFKKTLEEEGFSLKGIIVNRIMPELDTYSSQNTDFYDYQKKFLETQAQILNEIKDLHENVKTLPLLRDTPNDTTALSRLAKLL
jgi:anion-transporting  ArsA/GET3 family ATPase